MLLVQTSSDWIERVQARLKQVKKTKRDLSSIQDWTEWYRSIHSNQL